MSRTLYKGKRAVFIPMGTKTTAALVILVIVLVLFTAVLVTCSCPPLHICPPDRHQWTNVSDHKQIDLPKHHHLPACPKRIWTYWNTGQLPELIQVIMNHWRTILNDEWTITCVTDRTLSSFVGAVPEGFQHLSYQAKSDWIRLELVYVYGGIWADASTLFHDPQALEEIIQRIDEDQLDVFGFHNEALQTNPDFPVIETWCFAAPPFSPFVKAWKDEFELAINLSFSTYWSTRILSNPSIDPQYIALQGPYLTAYIALQYALQTKGINTFRIRSERASDAMYYIQSRIGWVNMIAASFWFNSDQLIQLPYVKLRGMDRKWIKLSHLKRIYQPDFQPQPSFAQLYIRRLRSSGTCDQRQLVHAMVDWMRGSDYSTPTLQS
jgi:hypothetical protein